MKVYLVVVDYDLDLTEYRNAYETDTKGIYSTYEKAFNKLQKCLSFPIEKLDKIERSCNFGGLYLWSGSNGKYNYYIIEEVVDA